MADNDIAATKVWANREDMTSSALNAEFSNIRTKALDKSQEQEASGRITFSGGLIVDELLTIAAAGAGLVNVADIRYDPASGTVADNDGMYLSWMYDDDAGNETEYMRYGMRALDVSNGTEQAEFFLQVAENSDGALDEVLTVGESYLDLTSNQALTELRIDNTATDGDAALAWQLSGTSKFTMGVDDGDSDKLKIGTTAIGTGTWFEATGALLTLSSKLTVGVDDTGYDVKFFGATSGSYALWDESADSLLLTDSTPLKIGDSQDLTLYHDGSNSYITNAVGALKIATETSGIAVTIGHGTSEVTIADNLTVTGTLTLGSGAELTEAELEFLDGITAGTAAASKAMVLDSSADITGGRNITISGELDAATLDVSGNADIDGTLEADAITIGSTAIGSIYGVVAGSSSIVTTGALNSGSITSGFGTIDTGSSTITTTGEIAAGSLDISGNVDIDGTTNLDAVDIDGAVQVDATITVGVDDAGHDVKFFGNTASAYMLWDTSTDDLILGGAAQLGIGTATPAYTFHVVSTTDGDFAAKIRNSHSTNGNGLLVNGADDSATFAFRVMDHDGSTDLLTVRGSGLVGIGDHTNANMTVGLTISQGAADNEIIALKSSDVDHGSTSFAETDTFFNITKQTAANGGAQLLGIEDTATISLNLRGLGAADNTTHTGGGQAYVMVTASKISSAGNTSPGANANLFAVRDGGTNDTKFIVDIEGDLFAHGSATTVYDAYDDVALLHAYDKARAPNDILAEHVEWLKYNEQALIEVGILGDTLDNGGLTNITRLQLIQNGAIRQMSAKQYDQTERIAQLEIKLEAIDYQQEEIESLKKELRLLKEAE